VLCTHAKRAARPWSYGDGLAILSHEKPRNT